MSRPHHPASGPVSGRAAPRRAAARDRLRAEVARSAVAGRLEVGRIVKLHAERIVAEGTLDGRPCFIKLFLGAGAGDKAREAEAVIGRARQHMSAGSFQVVEAFFVARLRGFLVLAAAPGIPLESAIAAAGPAGRSQLIRRAGAWLHAYCAPRREARRFSAERFAAFHEPRIRVPGWKGGLRDSPLIRALGAHLASRATAADGAPVSVAATHGDFVARNLHIDGSALHGFDIEGTRPLPVAWDLALFLVEITGREGTAGCRTWCGVRAADAEALIASGVIGAEEAAAVLPLYIGHHLLRRCIRMGPAPPFFDNVTEAAARLLADEAVDAGGINGGGVR